MKYLPYNHGPDFTKDYAPDSYLAIGAVTLMRICSRDAEVMRNLSRTGPANGGFDFDTYVRDCKSFDKIANRKAWILREAQ